MPLRATCSLREYRRAVVTHEAYFRGQEGPEAGVWMLVSNGTGTHPEGWSVWWIPGANADHHLPYSTKTPGSQATYVNELTAWDRNALGWQTMRAYMRSFRPGLWSRLLAGYSTRHHMWHLGLWYAVELYYQPGAQTGNWRGVWHTYVLQDQLDPGDHWRSVAAWPIGMRVLPLENPRVPPVLPSAADLQQGLWYLPGEDAEAVRGALRGMPTPSRLESAPRREEERIHDDPPVVGGMEYGPAEPPGLENHRIHPLR